ncbi:MAG: phytoene/squalene synthase family protein [Isosphaerales bacterium]
MRRNQALQASYRFCGALARRQARNFYYAFLLLPAARRRSMCALYAFLRRTDDLADEPGSAPEKARALEAWRVDLDGALTGQGTAWPGLAALADTMARHGIPTHLLHEVIEGVSMDIQPRRYATFDDLADYCHHVASVVGLCCLHIWGYRSEGGKAEQLAESCGIALQLTNIIRDVHDDARNGRVYLPEDDLARFGVEPRELAAGGGPSDRVRKLLAYEGERAYRFYDHARLLAPLVAPVGRPVLLTIVGIYRALLDEIARQDYNVLDGRVSVPPWRKAAIALRALAGRFTGGDSRLEPMTEPHASSDSIVTPR